MHVLREMLLILLLSWSWSRAPPTINNWLPTSIVIVIYAKASFVDALRTTKISTVPLEPTGENCASTITTKTQKKQQNQ